MASGVAEKTWRGLRARDHGFRRPCGGEKENPVGTIYIAVHTPSGDWARKLSIPGPRSAVKQRAVNDAIDWLRREVLKEARQSWRRRR